MNCIFLLGQNPQKNELLDSVFRKDFSVSAKSSSKEALESFLSEKPVLVIADASLTEETKSFLAGIKKLDVYPSVPVLLVVSTESAEFAGDFLLPGISDIIEFPFNAVIMRRRAENLISEYYCRKNIEAEAAKKARLTLLQKNEKLAVAETLLDNFIEIAVNNEFLVGTHAARMRKCVRIFLQNYAEIFPQEELSAQKIEDIAYASVFHDMGKILVPKEILLKNSALSGDEYSVVRRHTVLGTKLLRGVPLLHQKGLYKLCQDICKHHHERWNGEGYPDGLKGGEISLAAQAVGIIEAYIALQENRPYRKAFSEPEAFGKIMNGSCGSFSNNIIQVFEKSRTALEEAFSSF